MSYRKIIGRISPLWLGIGISGSLLTILFVSETVQGRWDLIRTGGEFDVLAKVSSGVLRDLRIAVVQCLVMGYFPAAFLHVMRSGRRTVMVLQGALNCTREECETLAASLRLSTWGLVFLGLLALLLSLIMPYMVPPVPLSPWSPSTWGPEVLWHRILGPLSGIWGFWLGYAIIVVSVRMSRIASKLSQIDLLDLSALRPFTQQGFTNALLLIGSLSIWSLMMLETGFGQMLWMIGGTTLLGTAVAFLTPVHGVHKRIVLAKEKELSWVNAKISGLRELLQNSSVAGRGGEMADLAAYRGLVEAVPEWPFTSSTYMRIILYTLLPIVAWGVGLVAEEILGRILL